ncbi:MAG: hypothetical protein MUE60_06585, partial [Candidatus Eisenbacteria bacterium]|nr:hypothetical protein [Candidatus Eisenbacteria bacterium]
MRECGERELDRLWGWVRCAFLLPCALLAQGYAESAVGWEIEVVDNGKQFSNMTDRSLRLDAQGHPHVAYGEDWLYYGFFDGLEWHYEVADSSPRVGQYASLALDSSGCPHISYYDERNGDLKYACREAAGWYTQTIDATGDVGLSTSITLGSSGLPRISYSDRSG